MTWYSYSRFFLLLFLCLHRGDGQSSFSEVPKPAFVGVIKRLPANGTIVAKTGQTIRISCQLTYPQLDDSTLNVTYWWQREDRQLWHSVKGKKRIRGLTFRVDDFMRKNRTIILTVKNMKPSLYGRYNCYFGTERIRATTKVCIGTPSWEQLEVFCNSKLSKSIKVEADPPENPVLIQPNTTVTLTCRLKPIHRLLQRTDRFQWTIYGWQIWFNGTTRNIAPPGATFAHNKSKQTWSMTVPNSTDLIGRRPACKMSYRRVFHSYTFAIVQAPPPPTPLPIRDMLPQSGYFGVFLIFLMIWMLLALNANK